MDKISDRRLRLIKDQEEARTLWRESKDLRTQFAEFEILWAYRILLAKRSLLNRR